MRRPTPTPSAQYVADRITPLDRDGLMIMAEAPESFPAYLVLRLCEPKAILGAVGPGIPRAPVRPPLATQRGGTFKLNSLGRAVLAIIGAPPHSNGT